MGFTFLEASVQACAVFPSIDAFAGRSALDEVTDIRIGSLGFALPLRHLSAIVAVAFISTAQICITHPAVVRHRRRRQCNDDGTTEQRRKKSFRDELAAFCVQSRSHNARKQKTGHATLGVPCVRYPIRLPEWPCRREDDVERLPCQL